MVKKNSSFPFDTICHRKKWQHSFGATIPSFLPLFTLKWIAHSHYRIQNAKAERRKKEEKKNNENIQHKVDENVRVCVRTVLHTKKKSRHAWRYKILLLNGNEWNGMRKRTRENDNENENKRRESVTPSSSWPPLDLFYFGVSNRILV